MTVTLRASELGWITGLDDDPDDQCAHGRILFQIDQTKFVSPEAGRWNVSAAGLFLLRTLDANHARDSSVTDGNLLFPCCGHFPIVDRSRVILSGCQSGVDLAIEHENGNVIVSASHCGREIIPEGKWREAVLAFAAEIEQLFRNSKPKALHANDDPYDGWIEFWKEWGARVNAARSTAE